MADYLQCNCFWCKKSYKVRKDVYQRQMNKYGHVCCKRCFGKEPSFKEARSKIMIERNPFAGKTHTKETRLILSELKKGNKPWNSGLTKDDNDIIKRYGDKVAVSKRGKHTGSDNPNWRGGISAVKQPIKPTLKKWLAFRNDRIKEDCFKCVKCNQRFLSNQLDVHHIAPRKDFPELEYDELNCITLCTPCHKMFHKRFGRKNVSPGATYDWINENRSPDEYFISC